MKGTVTVSFELDDCMTEDEAAMRSGVNNAHDWIRIMLSMDDDDEVADIAGDCAAEGLSLRRLTITSADGVQQEIYKDDGGTV